MNTNSESKQSWRKKYRTPLMNIALAMFFMGFPMSYLGGTQNNVMLIILSFFTFSIACVIPLVTKK